MPFFMMISGLLLSFSSKWGSKKQQVIRILINYGIPYVFFSALWVLMKIGLSGLVNKNLNYKDLLLIPIKPVECMWYLYALMIMQIIQVFIPNTGGGKIPSYNTGDNMLFCSPVSD